MKRFLFIISMMLFFVGAAFSQDTVDVAPGYNTLLDAVTANTTPGKVFRLQRGGTYTNDKSVEIKVPTIITGVKEPQSTPPPLLNMFADPGQAASAKMFVISADFKIQYCGIVGYSVLDEKTEAPFNIIKSVVDLTVDHCTIQSLKNVYWAGKDSVNVLFTNNTFWGIYWENWYGYGYFGNWGGNHVTHRLINNTLIGVGRYIDGLNIGPEGVEELDHNTVVNTHGKIDFDFNTRDEIVTNNIFYNIRHPGFVGPRAEWGYDGDADNDNLFVDTLDGIVYTDSIWGCIDYELLGDIGIDDYTRVIKLNNNLRYTSDGVLAYMKDITASWHPFLRPYQVALVEKYGWEMNDNILEVIDGNDRVSAVNPQFQIDPDDTDLRKGMDFWCVGFRDSTRRGNVDEWPPYPTWYPTNSATGEPFKRYELIWPITDFVNFKPLNEDLYFAGEDGYPLGDLNWFGQEVVDAWEAGEENPIVSVEKESNIIPTEFVLNQNFPNPFNPTTQISYSIPVGGTVSLKVFNSIGQEVATLVNIQQAPGNYSVNFNASRFASGVYMYRINVNDFTASKKMVLMK